MRFSSESPAIRWSVLAVVWVLLGWALFHHASYVGRYVAQSSALGLRGAPAPQTPLQQDALNFAADAQTWIRYALQLQEGDSVQLRYTHIDNAPVGREVHWNSAWAWIIAGAGKVRHAFTDEPLPIATERATLWINPTVLLLLAIIFSSWTARRVGLVGGIIVAAGMVGNPRFYEGFIPTYVDHHGLLTTAVFGIALGVILAGAGWWSDNDAVDAGMLPRSASEARKGAIFSAAAGACGFWVSAASVVPGVAIAGIAGLLVTWFLGRGIQRRGAKFDPEVWRLWGRTGALLSVGFYLLEYAPFHLGFRLEANHPFYAFAWWGGGELIAQIGDWRINRRRWSTTRLGLALVGIALVPLTVVVCGATVFTPLDPFMAGLHKSILEFLSLPTRVKMNGWVELATAINLDYIPVLVTGVLIWRQRAQANLLLPLAVLMLAAFVAMGLWQERWLLNASGPLICVLFVTLFALGRQHRIFRLSGVVIGLTCALYAFPIYARIRDFSRLVESRTVANKDATQALFRDVAQTLRASQPQGKIVLLSSPNSSTAVGYYGRFETLGTLYWENNDGLQAAAKIFSAQSEDEARELIKQRGVTHIAMISEENFIAQYYTLLHPNASSEDIKKCFGYQLLADRRIPQWLEVLPYKQPDDMVSLKITVLLFKVNFQQTIADATYHLALAQNAWDMPDAAIGTLDQLGKMAPKAPQPWLRKTEILLQQKKYAEAAVAMERAIELAPSENRAELLCSAGKSFYEAKEHALAVAMYRKAFMIRPDSASGYSLCWILATSNDDKIRDGREALALADLLVKSDPTSTTLLSCRAVALAECGRFDEAIAVANQVLELSKNDAPITAAIQRHLMAYRQGKPWRE